MYAFSYDLLKQSLDVMLSWDSNQWPQVGRDRQGDPPDYGGPLLIHTLQLNQKCGIKIIAFTIIIYIESKFYNINILRHDNFHNEINFMSSFVSQTIYIYIYI